MRLVAQRATSATVPGIGLTLELEPGDEIRTEISCKYTRASFESRLEGTGLRIDRWFTDRNDYFALALLGRTRGEGTA
jgi:L-histidine N-alpha-methyltransferase